jgi:hypothetical protein
VSTAISSELRTCPATILEENEACLRQKSCSWYVFKFRVTLFMREPQRYSLPGCILCSLACPNKPHYSALCHARIHTYSPDTTIPSSVFSASARTRLQELIHSASGGDRCSFSHILLLILFHSPASSPCPIRLQTTRVNLLSAVRSFLEECIQTVSGFRGAKHEFLKCSLMIIRL